MSRKTCLIIHLTTENYNFLKNKGIETINFNSNCILSNIIFTAAKSGTENISNVNNPSFKKTSIKDFPCKIDFVIKKKWRSHKIGLRSSIEINIKINKIIKQEFLFFIKTLPATQKKIHGIIYFLENNKIDSSPEAIERWRKFEQRNRNKQITFL